VNRTVVLLPTVGLAGFASQDPAHVGKMAVDDSTYIEAPLNGYGTGEWAMFRVAIPTSPEILAATVVGSVDIHVRFRAKHIHTPSVYGATVYRFHSPLGTFAEDDLYVHSFGNIGDPVDDGSAYREFASADDSETYTWSDFDAHVAYGVYLQSEIDDAEAFRISQIKVYVHCTDAVSPTAASGSFPWVGKFQLSHVTA